MHCCRVDGKLMYEHNHNSRQRHESYKRNEKDANALQQINHQLTSDIFYPEAM